MSPPHRATAAHMYFVCYFVLACLLHAGICAVEVEVDTLTGDYTILRTDIVMDVGNSINPAVDIGQVEGAWTQGMGWSTMEELVWGDDAHPWVRPGHLFTRGPGARSQMPLQGYPLLAVVHVTSPSLGGKRVHWRCL